jgi:hypothetical protein
MSADTLTSYHNISLTGLNYIADINKALAQKGSSSVAAVASDSILSSEKEANLDASPVSQAPVLPKAIPSTPDYLRNLTQAFCQVYSTMAITTMSQTNDLTKLQQLDQDMSECVLESTNKSIQAEKDNFSKQQQIVDEQAKDKKIDEALKIASYVIGGVLLALTIASAIIDLGASLAAVPEEITIEMTEMGGGEALADSTLDMSSNLENIGTNSLEDSQSIVSEGEGGVGSVDSEGSIQLMEESEETVGENSEDEITEEQSENETKKESIKSDNENGKSENNWKKAQRTLKNKWFTRGVGVMGSASFATPMIYQGITTMILGKFQEQFAASKKQVGQAIANLNSNNMFFQFYQQLVRRECGVTQDFTSQLSDVVQIASCVMNAYHQIPVSLAQTA